MANEYPLFPELAEAGKTEAVALIERFKGVITEAAKRAAEDAIRDLYTDIMPHIKSDSWENFRNDIVDGLSNYNNRKAQNASDFARIRKAIFEEYREEIIADLNQDHLARIAELEAEVQMLREREMERWRLFGC